VHCSYTPETAEKAIESGDADLITFGRPYLNNPDLPDRVANGWPLNDLLDYKYWYNVSDVFKTTEGYVIPKYQPASQ
jgi:N-ethylmaleimide reductase